MQLSPQGPAGVRHAALGTITGSERAPPRAAKRATRVLGVRRPQVANTSATGHERGQLVVGEQLGGDTGTAIAAGEHAARSGFSGRAPTTGAHVGEHVGDADLQRAQLRRRGLLLEPRARSLLRAEPFVQLDELVRTGPTVPRTEEQPLEGNEHARAA